MEQELNIDIDWVRHAESCANVAHSEISAHTTYHPNLTDLGIQQAIVVGNKYVKKRNEQKKYDFVCASPTFRAIMTSMMALRGTDAVIYVVPYISEAQTYVGTASWLTSTVTAGLVDLGGDIPNRPVDINILIQSITFIKDWLEKSWVDYFPDVELISYLYLVKEVLKEDAQISQFVDAIVENDEKNPNIKKKEILTQLIKQLEERSESGGVASFRSSYGMKPISAEDIDTIKVCIDIFNIFLSKDFIRCPRVDFSIYDLFITEHLTGKYKNEGSIYDVQPSFEKFYSRVLKHVVDNNIVSNKNLNVLCFSHGHIIKEELSNIYGIPVPKLKNTQVIHEKRKLNEKGSEKGSIDVNIYRPQTILLPKSDSENDGNIKEGEDPLIHNIMANKHIHNFCTLDGLKGILNYPIWNNDPTSLDKKGWIYTDKADRTKDVAFYYDEPKKYSRESSYGRTSILGGGSKSDEESYHKKYLKYKTKYVMLKKQ